MTEVKHVSEETKQLQTYTVNLLSPSKNLESVKNVHHNLFLSNQKSIYCHRRQKKGENSLIWEARTRLEKCLTFLLKNVLNNKLII